MADDASAHPDVLNATAQGQLKSIIERIERLEQEKAEISEQIKEVKAEAKGNGFDVKIINKVIRIRKQDRAKRTADKVGVKLSDWEGEFLTEVADRVKTYGRAFGDPEKGAPGEALSALQAVKLKEIAAKAKGEKKELKRRPFRRKGAD